MGGGGEGHCRPFRVHKRTILNSRFRHRLLASLIAILPVPVLAQSASGADDSTTLTEIEIEDSRLVDTPAGGARLDLRTLKSQRTNTSDSARLLEDIPGASTYGAGGISSLPVIRGLADDRLRTTVDGMDLMTACPNHMNPALSFVDPSKIASIEVFAGITPVSVGGDSIGSTIQVRSAPPKFAKAGEDPLLEGQLGGFMRSNGNGRGTNFGATLAGEWINFSYSQSISRSENYRAASDFKLPGPWSKQSGGHLVAANEVAATEYGGSLNREGSLALRLGGNHLLEMKVGEQKIDFEGFPNQRMDMVHSSAPDPSDPLAFEVDKSEPSNVNRIKTLRYTGQFEWGELETQYFHQSLRHHMDYLPERYDGMMMPMDADATTDGGLLKGSIALGEADLLRIGLDFQKYRLDDWWPPINAGVSMCCKPFWNIRNGTRNRYGIFAELETQWSKQWLTLLGVRGGKVVSEAGTVQGYSNSYLGDARAFNASDRNHDDRHLDATALARFTPSAKETYEIGLARKTRSPNLYERYTWTYSTMTALMNNFVGDGNAYIGNVNLKPEIAHTASVGADWHDNERKEWNFKLTGYVTHVKQYIDAQRCTPGMNTQCTASNVTTTDRYVKLQYINQTARLYGLDLSAERLLGSMEGVGSFTGTAMFSYVRGKNRTTGDNLYHMMPRNTKLALVHRLGGWTNTAEVQYVDDKTYVSRVRNEVKTPDYTLLNLRSSYEWKNLRLDLALENAMNVMYYLPLGGAYVGQGNSMTINGIPWGMSVPGRARSLNVGLNISF